MCDIVNDVLTVVIFIIIVHALRSGWGIWGDGRGLSVWGFGVGVGGGGGGGGGGLGVCLPPPLKVFCQYAHFLKSPLNVPLK